MAGIRIIFGIIKVFILFTGCTLLFYYGIMWVNQEYEGYHQYDKPSGAAVKVSTEPQENQNWFNRLLLYYSDGE
ncbi:YqzK family protein [Heyndrickxia acidicola]|uniref:YqzK family protein n=1 Tax=Heyndrickxia acidicola TaxID=209389 RepID=A0ABU6MMU9_9BACI|nr:YqzK family protein [Heyndrickxia acidicola]MED1204943.1 YqzK family protein [Heyndrickxia acidicola]